mmetsp:Transcript_26770/g.62902  ORF Transcript_26770/g.62902 Transcript_26770/m.62902 type:complete len:448 (+) Transcript_26770:29-1372(+)
MGKAPYEATGEADEKNDTLHGNRGHEGTNQCSRDSRWVLVPEGFHQCSVERLESASVIDVGEAVTLLRVWLRVLDPRLVNPRRRVVPLAIPLRAVGDQLEGLVVPDLSPGTLANGARRFLGIKDQIFHAYHHVGKVVPPASPFGTFEVIAVPIVPQVASGNMVILPVLGVGDRDGIPGSCVPLPLFQVRAVVSFVRPLGRVRVLAHAPEPRIRMADRHHRQYVLLFDGSRMLRRVQHPEFHGRVLPPGNLPPHPVGFLRLVRPVKFPALGDLAVLFEKVRYQVCPGVEHAGGSQHPLQGRHDVSEPRTGFKPQHHRAVSNDLPDLRPARQVGLHFGCQVYAGQLFHPIAYGYCLGVAAALFVARAVAVVAAASELVHRGIGDPFRGFLHMPLVAENIVVFMHADFWKMRDQINHVHDHHHRRNGQKEAYYRKVRQFLHHRRSFCGVV